MKLVAKQSECDIVRKAEDKFLSKNKVKECLKSNECAELSREVELESKANKVYAVLRSVGNLVYLASRFRDSKT